MPRIRPAREVIERRRSELGIERSELATLVEISYQHVYNIETGHKGASVKVLRRIADALGLTFDDVAVRDAA